MKSFISILAFVGSCTATPSAIPAQSDVSRTYTGVNGPQGGLGLPLPTPDKYVVNVYGGWNDFAVEVYSPGGDTCGREFYFTGTVSFQPNHDQGTIGGPMKRCTNPDLVKFCEHEPIYEVGYTGTIERSADHSRYLIKITWPDEKWLVGDCQKKRVDTGSETIWLTYAPPTPPPPTTRDKIERAERKAVDTVYQSFRGGRGLQRRPQ